MSMLIEKLREGGEKAVVGLTGYVSLTDYDSRRYYPAYDEDDEDGDDLPVHLKVKVVGLQTGNGCGDPKFVVEPIGGTGRFYLKSACQFILSKHEIQKKREERKRNEEKRELEKLLSTERIVPRRQHVYDALQGLVGSQAFADTISAECEEMGIDPNNPDGWKHHHCKKLADLVMELKYPNEEE